MVVCYCRFGTTYRSHLPRSSSPRRNFSLSKTYGAPCDKFFVFLKSTLVHSPFIFRLYKLYRLLKKTVLTECKRCVGSFNTALRYVQICSPVRCTFAVSKDTLELNSSMVLFHVIVNRCCPITRGGGGVFSAYFSGLTL
jgi:hypothetical protein